MAKKESTIFNMVATMFVITLVSSGVLAMLHEVTKEPIALAKQKEIRDKLKVVLPEFDNNPVEEAYNMMSADEAGELKFYPAKKDGEMVGTAVETFTRQGFGGEVKLMVGFLPDGTINEIDVILPHKETPGLGDKMENGKSDFHVQFRGKNPEDFQLVVKKDGGDVDAITASTISSRAYCDAVRRAYDTFIKGGDR
ncbi:MAG: RnfABCDGE type electron transport complex subunit G [Bacteroidetes bacterium]|nr:RnfABCDGE type electron transport complex subunit G [Bacteroidota bacterium]